MNVLLTNLDACAINQAALALDMQPGEYVLRMAIENATSLTAGGKLLDEAVRLAASKAHQLLKAEVGDERYSEWAAAPY